MSGIWLLNYAHFYTECFHRLIKLDVSWYKISCGSSSNNHMLSLNSSTCKGDPRKTTGLF